jgi:hypothetical protein
MLLQYPDLSCIGLDEDAALVLSESQVHVVSANGVAGCYIKLVQHDVAGGKSRVLTKEFRHTDGSISMDNLLQGKIPGK